MLIKNVGTMNNGKNIVKDGLVLWLDGKDFTNSPQTNPLLDRSGEGNNATPSGFAYTTPSGSDENGGIVFDGVDDYVNCGNSILADKIHTEVSWEFKVFRKKYHTNASIISKYLASFGKRSWNIREQANNSIGNTFSSDGENYYSVTSENDLLTNNVWVNVIITFNNGIVNYYKDGVFHSTSISAITSLFNNILQPAIIGKYSNYSDGTIKEVLIYNKVLTQAEITQNYNATK